MAKTQEELKELKEEYEALNEKLKELSDEELQKVAGGANYTKGNPKPIGYAFYISATKNIIFIISDVVRYSNAFYGYEYIIDRYYLGEYIGRNSINYFDYDIDNFVSTNGRPE